MRFIPVKNLEAGMRLGRDIVSPSRNFMLKKGVLLTDEYIGYLDEKGYLGAYINDAETADIELEEPVSEETLINSIIAVEKTDINGLVGSAQHIVAEMAKKKSISIDILDLRSFDDYTYHHSVNVAVYAVVVGRYMGMNEGDLMQLCQAGLCHDLGKQKINVDIINKPGKLSDEELREIKNHPKYSYDILYDNPDISATVRQAVMCHHENENGSGYPNGLDGSQLSIMAKILHAVDVFDALISRRPYKDPYSPADAFEYLIGGKGILFDEAVVEAMRKVIPAYPAATEVMLSTGERAIVVRQTNDPERPIVKIRYSQKYIDLSESANKNIVIVASGIMEMDYSRTVENLNEDRAPKKVRPLDIMLVDDSLMSLQQTTNALNLDCYNVIALQSGLAAINYIKEKGAPDLLIMDIEMPVMNGIQTVSSIRKMGYDDLPVMFLTAKGDKETILKCISVKAKDYIVKPVRPTYLKTRVAIALNASLER